ncbi:hypothetical protein B0H14DRAFT_3875626 [Mycena olivaceomarginata]|nr:hypothetical protein B0H14DRAFT_3875626 [Mycena olivaceomarginata]
MSTCELSQYVDQPFSVSPRTLDPQICDHLEPLDILAILPRLWRLDIEFPASECWQLIPYNMPLPMLQCLDAAFHNADCEDVLRNAPLLAELSWHRSMGTANLPSVRSKTLTKLAVTGDSLSVVQFISILQNCPLLADLTCVLDRKDIHDPAPLTFANLESLRFSWPSPHALDLPTLPNLARLGCDLSSDPEVTGSFLRHDPVDVWRTYLDLFSSVETVAISSVEVKSLLDLTSREDNEDGSLSLMLPKLRNLTIRHPNHIVPSDYNYILDLNRGSAGIGIWEIGLWTSCALSRADWTSKSAWVDTRFGQTLNCASPFAPLCGQLRVFLDV